MPAPSEILDHWVNVDPERMERYESMFQWTSAAERFYEPAQIGDGHVVVDFGCALGDASIEFARRVGNTGHVHGIDVNADFISRAKEKADRAGVGNRTSFHLLDDTQLPLAGASTDRVVSRNTIIYVADPVATLSEFRRILRPGGVFHAIESDWSMTVVEPVGTERWRQIIAAASWAWPRPEIGRQLYGFARQAGFGNISVEVVTAPDIDGRLLGMIRTVAGYAKERGGSPANATETMLQTVDAALQEDTYLALAPQFLVTARV
jgi:SAM-dependent methyltransferase